MNDEPKQKRRVHPDNFPCPVCGALDFTWGNIVRTDAGLAAHFRPLGAGWGGGRRMYARECDQCGNVLMFTQSR